MMFLILHMFDFYSQRNYKEIETVYSTLDNTFASSPYILMLTSLNLLLSSFPSDRGVVSLLQWGDLEFNPQSRKIPWRNMAVAPTLQCYMENPMNGELEAAVQQGLHRVGHTS